MTVGAPAGTQKKLTQRNRGHFMGFELTSLLGKILPLGVVPFAFAMNAAGCASAQTVVERPCDVIGSATPCVAAISTTRALYASYSGPLYQVMRASDKTVADIGLLKDG
jgi:hypothetical protein